MTPSDERQATILVVDDEPAIVRMLVEALNGPELSVLTATRGDKAIEMYRQHLGKIDLVLLDLQMYPLNGLQLLAELRRIDPHVRVAFMSGSPSEGPVAEMAEAGVVSVFSKPFLSLTDLAAALGELVRSQSSVVNGH
jgi:two-component system, cell cycle sensor histidine kinase and response regulator CckA